MATVGGYILQDKIRSSNVYEIHTGLSTKHVQRAIKVAYSRHPNFSGRSKDLQNEFKVLKVLKSLDSPYIINVYEFGKDKDKAFMSMDYIQGQSLRKLMRKDPDWVKKNRYQLIQTVTKALVALEENKIVHRDLKPDNIMITPEGKAILIDFSIAMPPKKKSLFGFGSKGKAQGTREYMAPEQIRNDPIDMRADIYAFGAMTYEILSGKLPFQGSTPEEILSKHLKSPVPSLKAVREGTSHQLDAMVKRMMAKSPEQRYPQASTLLREMSPEIFN